MLPSAEALALGERLPVGSDADRWASALRVPVEDIKSVSAELPSGKSAAGIIVLSVVVSVMVIVLIANSGKKSQPSGGCDGPVVNPLSFGGAHLTTRPFDRYRRCYVDDPLAMADPWPGPTECGPATALADPATSLVLAR